MSDMESQPFVFAGPRRMPSKSAIRSHWLQSLLDMGKFVCIHDVHTGDPCWSCGRTDRGSTERAHIVARCRGGSDTVENLHLLCPSCHVDSEFISGNQYWEWFMSFGADYKEQCRSRKSMRNDRRIEKTRYSVHLSEELISRARRAAFWSRETVSNMAEAGLRAEVERLEQINGGPFAAITTEEP